ncbi:phytanoyl-CoA dioxygenase family protein [Gammaproteobacteria bacterium]|nr:phytanoyl-CoA dioxygenase family protein [Gammaproteobacteria bacterium]
MTNVLTDSQQQAFQRDGFLCIDDVVPANVIDAIHVEYQTLIEQVADRFGLIDDNWHQQSFDERITSLLSNHPEAYEQLDISLPMSQQMTASAGVHCGPAVFALLTEPALLDIAESVLGGELYCNPIQHTRIKPPERHLDTEGRGNSNMARTGWHQDTAVTTTDAHATPMLTVWVAITDATLERGCMQAVPGSHHWESVGMHCPGKGGVGEIFIPESLVREYDTQPLAVKAGGVVLLHTRTWHGAGPNLSDHVRWSFDLRYQPIGLPSGRDFFPGFIARSRQRPDHELHDARQWQRLWHQAREEIAAGDRDATFNERWEQWRNHPLCA